MPWNAQDYIDEDEPISFADHHIFKEVRYRHEPEPDPDIDRPRRHTKGDPGLSILGLGSGPSTRSNSSSSTGDLSGLVAEQEMSNSPSDRPFDAVSVQNAARHLTQGPLAVAGERVSSSSNVNDELQATASRAMQHGVKALQNPGDTIELASRPAHRVDSAQDSQEIVPQVPEKGSTPINGCTSPLKVQTGPPADQAVKDLAVAKDSITNSPTLRKHVITPAGAAPSTLQSTSSLADNTASTARRKESLPPFKELAGLAEIASQQVDARVPAPPHRHSISISSTAVHSPIAQYFPPYASSVQTSPVSSSTFARSPASTVGGSLHYGSPTDFTHPAYFSARRSSAATSVTPNVPASVPSLPSGSSTESYGTNASSNADGGYSTSHTTPIDGPGSVPTDGLQRPVLPPPLGMASSFKCDYPGCNAIPFQTQYLLSSHRNVHSSSRPHYCPVKDCPRSEGGKGFKRKNEMIRHGLVHNSPGYVCPFCPDREHRYPRPDNLQRHVRVHHVDKDRDDPALREVLAQRTEGTNQKQRRRRTQGSISEPNSAGGG